MTAVDDLVRWLGEQLDTDAARAEEAAAARGGHWSAQSWQNGRRPPRHYVGASAEAGVVRSDSEIMSGGAAAVRHAATHDPARVLREIDAKRQVLAVHTITVEKVDAPPFDSVTGARNPDEYTVTCAVCGWSSDDPMSACLTLRLLALPYADRPGYLESWRP